MEIIKRLFVGDDEAYERLKDKPGWSFLRCCKDGPGGHRQTLGYTTLGAPKGQDYLFVRDSKTHMALNLLDHEDPKMIPDEVLDKGIEFIDERMKAGDKVLAACNAGASRSPTIVMMYLRTIGELDQPFNRAKHIFHTLYSKYDPGHGLETHARAKWDELKGINYGSRRHE